MANDAQTLGLEFIKEEPVHLPDDLVFLILSKLPLKSLKRFTCVCKLWALLFQNPHFMKIFVNNFESNWSNDEDTSLLLCQIIPGYIQRGFKSSLFSLSSESIQNMVKLEWPNPFQEDDPNFEIMGSTSINGILCLYQLHGLTVSAVLWNPATAESKVIPPSPVDPVPPNQDCNFTLTGFGYDRVRDDYKVIRHACFFPNGEDYNIPGPPIQEPVWEIYSLRSNSWRTLDFDDRGFPYCRDYTDRLYLDGMCHWIGCADIFENSETYLVSHFETFLVSFDLSNEVFYTTSISLLDSHSSEWLMGYLLLLNDSVAMITNPKDTTHFYISILGQVGVKESWTKLFTFELLPCVGRPIGTGKKGNIFFAKDDCELIQFDLSAHMIDELGIKGAKAWSQVVLYKKSFRQILEINN